MQEKKLFQICEYSHDYDGAVYEEKRCWCALYQKGNDFFIRRHFTEAWDYETKIKFTEDIPIQRDDLHRGLKKLSAMYCHGHEDNPWITTYQIHRDEDDPNQKTVLQMISENS